ncbi:site-2 protease family protein [Streptosporangium sp. NPDC000396]|uniref:site-2 protease family protein n=1 Tax=Streptosporangium sp. NPDC000396 TaxID=3366185 RepID=UPI00368380CE
MRPSLRLGNVAGIPVGIHWSALLVIALIMAVLGTGVLPAAVPGLSQGLYWGVAAVVACAFFASLLAHELAHALVARRLGVRVGSITLWLMGGITELDGEARTPRAEAEISAAGPLTSLAFAAVAGLVLLVPHSPLLISSAVAWFALVNAVLGLFNLLPGAPLDGGRVLHAFLWWRYRDRSRADRTAAQAGQSLGMFLVAAGVLQAVVWSPVGGLWMVLIGWFMTGAARAEAFARSARSGLTGLRMRDVMTSVPDLAPSWLKVDAFVATVALRSRQSVFPVVDFSGAPVGAVSLETISALTPEQRAETNVAQLARKLPSDHVVAPDDPAARILDLSVEPAVLVVENGHVTGLVTPADFTRILMQASLRSPPRDDAP